MTNKKTLVFFLLLFLTILSWEKSEAIRLEYKFSAGQYLTYSEIQIFERHDIEKHLDQTIEYTEMNYTEQIIEINSTKNIQRKIHSIRIIPKNQYKYNQLFETTYRQFGEQLTSRPVEIASIDGRILLAPPNEPTFPDDDIHINQSWIVPIMNSLGEVHYKLINIDENELAEIEFEGGLAMSPDANIIGKWNFDIQRGITLIQQSSSTSSLLSDRRITKTVIQKLLSIK